MGIFGAIGGLAKKALPIAAGVFGGPLAGMAVGGAMGALGKKKKPAAAGGDPRAGLEGQFYDAIGDERKLRQGATERYDRTSGAAEQSLGELDGFQPRSYDFDPSQAMSEYAGGALSDMDATVKRRLTDLRRDAGAQGRLETGMFDEDQGDVITEVARGTSSDLARQATTLAGFKNDATMAGDRTRLGALDAGASGRVGLAGQAGNYASSAGGNYMDALVGGMNNEQNKANASAEQAENRRRGIFGFLGTAAQTALPYILKPKS